MRTTARRKARRRTVRIVYRDETTGRLGLLIQTERSQDGYYATPIPASSGRAWRIVKELPIGDDGQRAYADLYHVHLNEDGTTSCDCAGAAFGFSCKHQLALAALVSAGRI